MRIYNHHDHQEPSIMQVTKLCKCVYVWSPKKDRYASIRMSSVPNASQIEVGAPTHTNKHAQFHTWYLLQPSQLLVVWKNLVKCKIVQWVRQ